MQLNRPLGFPGLHRLSFERQWHRHRSGWADAGARRRQCLEDEGLFSWRSSRHQRHRAKQGAVCYHNACCAVYICTKTWMHLHWLWGCSQQLLHLLHCLHQDAHHGPLQTDLHPPPTGCIHYIYYFKCAKLAFVIGNLWDYTGSLQVCSLISIQILIWWLFQSQNKTHSQQLKVTTEYCSKIFLKKTWTHGDN